MTESISLGLVGIFFFFLCWSPTLVKFFCHNLWAELGARTQCRDYQQKAPYVIRKVRIATTKGSDPFTRPSHSCLRPSFLTNGHWGNSFDVWRKVCFKMSWCDCFRGCTVSGLGCGEGHQETMAQHLYTLTSTSPPHKPLLWSWSYWNKLSL